MSSEENKKQNIADFLDINFRSDEEIYIIMSGCSYCYTDEKVSFNKNEAKLRLAEIKEMIPDLLSKIEKALKKLDG